MSGEAELKNTNDRWNADKQKIEEFISSLGVNKIKYNSEVEQFLTLTKEQINKLTQKDIYTGAYLLTQYAIIIQREVNSLYSKLEWAKHNLEIVVGKRVSQYGTQYTKFEERRSMLISDDSYASALNSMILECTVRLRSLDFLSNKIIAMSKLLGNIKYEE